MITGPMYQNPLAGGSLFRPQENQLQGDALVEQMQMRMNQRDQKTPAFLAFFRDVMDTKGYPTKTMQDYESQFPNPLTERIVTQEDGMNLSGSNVPLSMLNVTPPSVPVSEQTPMSGLPDIPKAIRSPGLPSLDQGPLDNVEPLKTVKQDTQPFDRIGQQMINFDDMFGPLNTRLNKIEEGIASLLQNRGQGLNMNTMPTRNLNNFFQEPIGTFPFRSFYG